MDTNFPKTQDNSSVAPQQRLVLLDNSDERQKQIKQAISQQLQQQDNDLKRYIRNELVKRAALSFLQEYRSFLFCPKSQQQESVSKRMKIKLSIEPLPQQSDEDDHSEQNGSILQSSSSQCSIQSDQQSVDSNESIFTFHPYQNDNNDDILLEKDENIEKDKSKQILLESGNNTQQQKQQKREKHQSSMLDFRLNKLKKRLKQKYKYQNLPQPKDNKKSIQVKKLQHNNSQMKDQSKDKNNDSKSIKKLQKMIQKMEINQQSTENKKQQSFDNDQNSQNSADANHPDNQSYQSFQQSDDGNCCFNCGQHVNQNQKQSPFKVLSVIRTKLGKKIKTDQFDKLQSHLPIISLNFTMNVSQLLSDYVQEKKDQLQFWKSKLQDLQSRNIKTIQNQNQNVSESETHQQD